MPLNAGGWGTMGRGERELEVSGHRRWCLAGSAVELARARSVMSFLGRGVSRGGGRWSTAAEWWAEVASVGQLWQSGEPVVGRRLRRVDKGAAVDWRRRGVEPGALDAMRASVRLKRCFFFCMSNYFLCGCKVL
jgi:hypothetical protein